MEDKKDKREKPNITNNFNGNVGQVINNVEVQHVHFDKDMQMEVQQHVEEQHIEAARADDKTIEEKAKLTFEEAIPEKLRTGIILPAWNRLRDENLLKEDYTLNTTFGGAKYIAKKICEMHNRTLPDSQDKKNKWRPFELLWGIEKNTLKVKGNPGKEIQAQIDKIFNNI